MANWKIIKSMRRWNNVLTLVIIVLVVFTFYSFVKSFEGSKNQGVSDSNVRVIAKSGLKIRESPTLVSNVIIVAPYNSLIEIVYDINTKSSFDSTQWCNVIFRGNKGYAWKAFLK